jgi:hypothetical protein
VFLLTQTFLSLRRKQMADTIYAPDPWSALSAQHSDIRREGSVERGEIRYDVATRSADNRYANAVGQADIRREQAIGFGETKYAIATSSEDTNRDILTTGANTAVKVDEAADKILQRSTDFFIAEQARDFDMGRDLSDLKATVLMANQKTAGDIALASERVLGATALSQAQTGKEIAENKYDLAKQIGESKYDLSRQIGIENEKTRDLINALKNDELNRILIERNTDLQHCRHDYWGARDGLFNSQFAALSSQVNSQVNALNSQLAETRQGLVNFGSMNGNAGQQSSTSNQVR